MIFESAALENTPGEGHKKSILSKKHNGYPVLSWVVKLAMFYITPSKSESTNPNLYTLKSVKGKDAEEIKFDMPCIGS